MFGFRNPVNFDCVLDDSQRVSLPRMHGSQLFVHDVNVFMVECASAAPAPAGSNRSERVNANSRSSGAAGFAGSVLLVVFV